MNQTLTPSVPDWHARAAALAINGQAFIDGRYVAAASGETFDDVTPIDGRVIARVASTDQADVERAVAAARRAFDSGVWSRQSPRERKRVLQRFAELILAHGDELALLETLDMGKPISDSLAVDIPATARCIAWYAEAVDKVYDEIAPTAHDQLALITREPIGVVAAIVPWNFPLIMAAWKIGPALAAGNSFILKPSEKSPLSAIRLAALATEAGIPDGVFNVLPGYGHTAGQALALHMDVDCIGFTGSTRTGKLMLQYSGQSNMKRVWLECGGKSPNIILADCPDLDRAAATAAGAIFFNQGQMCTAAARLVIEESVRDRVLEKVVEASRAMQPGDPLDPATRMGAIVDEIQTKSVLGHIDSGKSEGAAVVAGGQRVREHTGGCYIEPTVFADVTAGMRIAREEIFGPVLAAITVKDAEEAVRVGNGVEYGLAAAVWTRDIGKAHRIAKSLRAGMVYVNCYDADDITVPFGGFKQSGTGRDKSLHAFDKYTELKTTWIDISQ
jgi:acyl-CoA reductase-like NAD-dependent aldehyde dehydrogenase